MFIEGFVTNILEKTFSNHPYWFLLLIFAMGGTVVYGHYTFAEESDIQRVEGKIGGLEKKVDHKFAQSTLYDLNREISDIERAIQNKTATSRDHERLVKARNQVLIVELELQALAKGS